MENKKRLIDANELLRIYKKWIPQLSLPEDEGDLRGVETCIAVLEDAPTVDAVEVVHGYNKYDHDSAFECSVCGFNDWDTYTADIQKYNYCPNCGAKMDGDRNG